MKLITILDYHHAIKRLEVIFDAKQGTPEGNELDKLGDLIVEYEKENHHI